MITAIGELMTSYIVDKSKFWVHERSDLRCQQYWWRNVLYIQNLFNVDDLCLNWTWSLACEMQYYIISTALLFVYAKYVSVSVSSSRMINYVFGTPHSHFAHFTLVTQFAIQLFKPVATHRTSFFELCFSLSFAIFFLCVCACV